MVAADAAAIVAIYNHYITHTIVTFEEVTIDAAEMARRIAAVQSDNKPWIVAELGGNVVGWAYASKWKERFGYRFSVETSVYLAPDAGGKGLGSALYTKLFAELRSLGLRNALGGICLPNDASIALHEKFGFKKVAHIKNIGIKFNKWHDVAYWQLELQETK